MEPVSCKFCSIRGNNTKFATLDERKMHAQLHTLKMGYIISEDDSYKTTMKLIFAECFPSDSLEKLEDIAKSRSTLMDICQSISIKAKMNESNSNSIDCYKCGSHVRYTLNNGSRNSSLIFRHACRHSMKKPFVCRICHCESMYKADIVKHVKNVHKVASPDVGVHFDENWIDCFDEIRELLTKCFGELNLNLKLRRGTQTLTNVMEAQRRSIFVNIWKKRDKGAEKMRCDKCRRDIGATSIYRLEQHVSTHLQRRVYECVLCHDYASHKSSIVQHFTNMHDAPLMGNYVDHSAEYQEEIMDLAMQCFGQEVSK